MAAMRKAAQISHFSSPKATFEISTRGSEKVNDFAKKVFNTKGVTPSLRALVRATIASSKVNA